MERTYTKSGGILLKYGNQHYLPLDQKQSYDVRFSPLLFSVPSSPCQKRRRRNKETIVCREINTIKTLLNVCNYLDNNS